jgi:diguanylate cyclase (GGDEF)-like protein/PAS domain S-box-containing protein
LGLLKVTPEVSTYLEEWYQNQPEFKRQSNNSLTNNIHIGSPDSKKNAELEKSLSLVRATLECTADGIMMVNGKGDVVDWNQKFVHMWRIPSHLMEAGPKSLSFEYILDQLTNPQQIISDVEFLYSHPGWQGNLPELYFKDGRIFERYTQPQKVRDEIVGRVYSFRDVTQKKLSEEELRIRERAIEASTHGIAIIDIQKSTHPVIYVNKAFKDITDFKEKNIIGEEFSTLFAPTINEANSKRIELAIREQRNETVEVELIRKSGEPFWCQLGVAPVKNNDDEVKHFIYIVNDITEYKEMEQALLQQATHDALTGLPNRVLLMDRAEQAIIQVAKKKKQFAFLFIDIDRFKMTNDTLGHGLGDKLLQAISNKLLIATNEFDTVARFGGDEFVILLPDLQNINDAEMIAQEILTIIQKPIKVDQHQLKVTASIGISYYPKDGENYESLMKSADLSMYHAKDSGRNTYRVFENEMNRRVINYAQIDSELRSALSNNEFYLLYQPLVDVDKKKVVGFEALLRWCNPMLGHISPIDFIPIAEENGLIIDIGSWVIEEACQQAVNWQKRGYTNLTMAVNVSGRQLHQSQLCEHVKATLKKTGLKPEFLELELTESLLVENIDVAVDIMHKLKKLGVKLAIDDFGTGYSSLSYLKQFPVDKLKIDRSFISEISKDKNDAAIVCAIINLAHSLKLSVLAEGVEYEYQKSFISANGCSLAQGYYFCPPSKQDIVEEFIKNFSAK